MFTKQSWFALQAYLLLTLFWVGSAPGAFAQNYPTKPVQVVCTFTKGSATDVIARTLGQKLSELWGQTVTVENRAGAGGTIAAGLVAKSPPDGYTLLVHSSAYVANPAFYRDLPYGPLEDFVDIALLARQPMALVVGSSSDANSLSELIQAAKEKPGELNFGSPGIGSAAHLAAEKFKSQAGIDPLHVPYKGGPETIAATGDGSVTYSFMPLAMALKGVRAGKLRALGVTSTKRVRQLPDVPTIAEAGLPGFESTVWWGLWAPADVPPGVVDQLEKDVARAFSATDVREKLTKRGFEPMSMTSAEFARFVRRNMEAVARIVKEAGIKPK